MSKIDEIAPKLKSIINVVYKDSKNTKIIKIFQQEVGGIASKIIHPELTILSYVVKLWAQLGKAKRQNFFLKIFLSDFFT